MAQHRAVYQVMRLEKGFKILVFDLEGGPDGKCLNRSYDEWTEWSEVRAPYDPCFFVFLLISYGFL